MNKRMKKVWGLMLVFACMLSLLGGCKQEKKPEDTDTQKVSEEGQETVDPEKGTGENEEKQENQENQESQEGSGEGETEAAAYFPLAEKEDLSLWMIWENSYMNDPNEMKVVQEMERQTNVHINYQLTSSQTASEKFGLMIAGGDYPDIVMGMMTYYSGGIQKGIEDGVFLDMTDYVEQYMPTYLAYAKTNEDAYRMIMSDEGKFPLVYSFSDSNSGIEGQQMFLGLTIRKDWLDELELPVPETIEDWHTVLKAFKEKKNVEAPLMLMNTGVFPYSAFATAFGIGSEWYVENGMVKYGPAEEGWKEYLGTLRDWYAEGLIDQNFAGQQSMIAPSDYMATGRAGAGCNLYVYGGDMYFKMGFTEDSAINYIAAPYPVKNAGDLPRATASENLTCNNFSLTVNCKNPELAARWLDYQYTDEAMMLYNYGIEGESYTIDEAGNIAFTDEILHNPDDYTPSDALGFYFTHTSAPGRQNWEAETYLYDASNYVMQEIWSDVDNSLAYPDNATMTSEEGDTYNSVYTNLKTLVDEMATKCIMGSQSLDDFDAYVKDLYSYGLQDCIAIKQAAYDRFMNRGK